MSPTLEALETRSLQSVITITGPPVPAPPPTGTLPPVHIKPPPLPGTLPPVHIKIPPPLGGPPIGPPVSWPGPGYGGGGHNG